eukprot:TRINITY_DN45351_c0_g1_i1.p3 TRINITY_DN45351_c0_g1~~TRINITY_DN45351_c0_g1_i1.p3  ORF type:complete len:112 (+),score=20.11 TRINITY_DN45351_c0_g1_i1:255-590(+)
MGPSKAIPLNFTSWDKIILQGPMNLDQFCNIFKNNYQVKILLITYENYCFYNIYQKDYENEKLMATDLEEIIEIKVGKKIFENQKYIEICIFGDTLDEIDAIMPNVVIKRF